ncbi:hypothetical protein KFE94_07115 [bacterium SCSIO 12643]|nr:hypothetical protein KFE94_07115 [bacterium SCSIO 12643]
MLNLTKYVLEKVSFDKKLFKKELIKATKALKKEELMLLYTWGVVQFASEHQQMVKEIVSPFI